MVNNLPPSQQIVFNGNNGFSTKIWGPRLWDSLFTMILGTYPPLIDINNSDHKKIKKVFIGILHSLKYTLPCSFCRESYKSFLKELPIEKYTDSRVNMLYWLYLMKDKVNKKIIRQELDYLNELYKKYKSKKISKLDYINYKKKCFKTKSSPPFIDVLNNYEQYRAKCNKKLKKC